MPLKPAVGSPGGQRYDVAHAIRTFLEQMAGGGGFSFGGAVIKELIQNADDAGASELVVALDERNGEDLPPECSEYRSALGTGPARSQRRAVSHPRGGPGRGSGRLQRLSATSPAVTSDSIPQLRVDSE